MTAPAAEKLMAVTEKPVASAAAERLDSDLTADTLDDASTTEEPNDTMATEELDIRIQKLPQELQDWIMDLVIADGMPSDFVDVKEDYKPPLGLQIDHKSREKFAKEYYKLITYRVLKLAYRSKYDVVFESLDHAYSIMKCWLKKLSWSHLQLLEVVQFGLAGITEGLHAFDSNGRKPVKECNYARTALGPRLRKVWKGVVALRIDNVPQGDGTLKTEIFRQPLQDEM